MVRNSVTHQFQSSFFVTAIADYFPYASPFVSILIFRFLTVTKNSRAELCREGEKKQNGPKGIRTPDPSHAMRML